MQNYYTIADLKKKVNIGGATVERWKKKFEDTPLIQKVNGRILFSEDFITFLIAREGKLGPSILPEPQTIALLFQLFHELEGNETAIAEAMNGNEIFIHQWLVEIGCLQ